MESQVLACVAACLSTHGKYGTQILFFLTTISKDERSLGQAAALQQVLHDKD